MPARNILMMILLVETKGERIQELERPDENKKRTRYKTLRQTVYHHQQITGRFSNRGTKCPESAHHEMQSTSTDIDSYSDYPYDSSDTDESIMENEYSNERIIYDSQSLDSMLQEVSSPRGFSKFGFRSGKAEGIAQILLRWPLLLIISLILISELLFYLLIRIYVSMHEATLHGLDIIWKKFDSLRQRWFPVKKQKIKKRIIKRFPENYSQWKSYAKGLDDATFGVQEWKRQIPCDLYDWKSVLRVVKHMDSSIRRYELASSRSDSESQKEKSLALEHLSRVLIEGALKPNLGGVENVALYRHSNYGTKKLIEKYVRTTLKALELVYEQHENSSIFKTKYDFIKQCSKQYGQTALCLSGGATFGYYHLGLIKALLDQDLLPNVITGTSAGSLIASFVCVRSNEELVSDLNPGLYKYFTACDTPLRQRFHNLMKTGAVFDCDHWIPKLQPITKGDTTFLEAFKMTGKILNISVVSAESEHAPARLLNYKTAPDIVIWSAVLASSAVPGILPPVCLKRKLPDGSITTYESEGSLWRDGSLRIDIPLQKLNRMFNVNSTIVSQVNPHIILFFFDNRGSGGRPTMHRRGRGWRGGFLSSYIEHSIKLDLLKWLRVIRDLDLLPNIPLSQFSNAHDFLTSIFLQRFDGSITIVPRPSFSDYWLILTDPTYERMKDYIIRGQLNCWPKICMISNRMRIERAIDSMLKSL